MVLLKKIFSMLGYFLYLFIVIAVFDVVVLHKLLGEGYARHYEEENIQRYPAPYVAFTGKPNVLDHNESGFRGSLLDEAGTNDFKIAFFGGSTGYNGDPTIANTIESELTKLLGINVFVANYSVVSSNHRQHLHGIVEYMSNTKPDLIVFYGGYNEMVSSAYYDPRPGYPYNYFYRAETSPLVKLLLENSAIIGSIDEQTGIFSGINKLRKQQQPYSDDWNKRISDKYFETLRLAHDVAGAFESNYFGKTKFLAFYQPYQVPDEFGLTHQKVKDRILNSKYIVDVSSEYDALGKNIYSDIVHVNQHAKNLMGTTITDHIFNKIKNDWL